MSESYPQSQFFAYTVTSIIWVPSAIPPDFIGFCGCKWKKERHLSSIRVNIFFVQTWKTFGHGLMGKWWDRLSVLIGRTGAIYWHAWGIPNPICKISPFMDKMALSHSSREAWLKGKPKPSFELPSSTVQTSAQVWILKSYLILNNIPLWCGESRNMSHVE